MYVEIVELRGGMGGSLGAGLGSVGCVFWIGDGSYEIVARFPMSIIWK
jgi:hypothetical protein